MDNNVLLKQVELFISYLEKLNYNDIHDLQKGSLRIVFVKQKEDIKDSFIEDYTYGQYVDEIRLLTTREQCLNYFEKASFQKKDLEGILRHLGLSFNKKDNKNKLQSKIIENTIGNKLRKEAIINK